MKKILFLMAILPIIVFTACSSDDEEEIINISFSETEISIPVGDEYDLKINGIDISECNIYSQDEFIAYAMSHGGKINISADHTGETKVIA